MKVLVDTTVVSLALRRARPDLLAPADHAAVERFRELAKNDQAVLIGAIRQEALSGLKSAAQFAKVQTVLDGFQYLPTDRADHDAAAEAFNQCRSRGIAAGPIDMLICASAIRYGLRVFTADVDFVRYASVLRVRLYDPAL